MALRNNLLKFAYMTYMADLQLVEIAILIGQFQSDRAFNVQLRKSIPSILFEKHNRFTFLNLVIMR